MSQQPNSNSNFANFTGMWEESNKEASNELLKKYVTSKYSKHKEYSHVLESDRNKQNPVKSERIFTSLNVLDVDYTLSGIEETCNVINLEIGLNGKYGKSSGAFGAPNSKDAKYKVTAQARWLSFNGNENAMLEIKYTPTVTSGPYAYALDQRYFVEDNSTLEKPVPKKSNPYNGNYFFETFSFYDQSNNKINDINYNKLLKRKLLGGTFYFAAQCSGYVITIPNSSTKPGEQLIQSRLNGSFSQKFYLTPVDPTNLSNQYYRVSVTLLNQDPQLYWDLKNNVAKNGTEIQTCFKTSYDAQLFQFNYLGKGLYEILVKTGPIAVDVTGASQNDGAKIQAYQRNNTTAQQWRLLPTNF